MNISYKTKWANVSVDLTEDKKNAIVERVLAYYKEHEAFDGEVICQNDDCIIDATGVLADIADNILKFEVEYESSDDI